MDTYRSACCQPSQQVFWRNKRTGETRWEPPTPVKRGLVTAELDISSPEGRQELVQRASGSIRAPLQEQARLAEALAGAVQEAGSDEEWRDLATCDDRALLVAIGGWVRPGFCRLRLQNAAARALLLLSNLGMLSDYLGLPPARFHPPAEPAQLLLDGALAALPALHGLGAETAGSFSVDRQVWLSLLVAAVPESRALQDSLGAGGGTKLERLVELAAWALREEARAVSGEGEAEASAKLVFCLNYALATAGVGLRCRGAVEAAGRLEEMVLFGLNEAGYPAHDQVEARWHIKFLVDVLGDPARGEAFHANDLGVLIDIVLRELRNMPAEEELASDYLALLQVSFGPADDVHAFEHARR
jgi:hypothetical protein